MTNKIVLTIFTLILVISCSSIKKEDKMNENHSRIITLIVDELDRPDSIPEDGSMVTSLPIYEFKSDSLKNIIEASLIPKITQYVTKHPDCYFEISRINERIKTFVLELNDSSLINDNRIEIPHKDDGLQVTGLDFNDSSLILDDKFGWFEISGIQFVVNTNLKNYFHISGAQHLINYKFRYRQGFYDPPMWFLSLPKSPDESTPMCNYMRDSNE